MITFQQFDFSRLPTLPAAAGGGIPTLNLRPELPETTQTLIGVDLTHRIDVDDIAGGLAAAKGGPAGGGSGGGGGGTSSFAPYTTTGSNYNITIEFKGTWTQEYYDIFKGAADLLTSIINSDVPDVSVRMRGTILRVDDLYITAELGNIDGTGGILGQAGPTSIRTGSYLPATATMKFDIADANVYLAQGLFDDIVLHEMMHSEGFGSIWGYKNLVANNLYVGPNALSEYRQTAGNAGATGIPVETDGGSGTAGAHWDDLTFQNELMTGYIDGSNYFSAMSVGALEDLGYKVDDSPNNDLYDQYAANTNAYLSTLWTSLA